MKLEFSPETANACPVFAARTIRGVTNGPSPDWLQNRLKAVGLRPINALVDVTNYISQDRGRPLHVYDADKIRGAIRARLGKPGEKFLGSTARITPPTRRCASSRMIPGRSASVVSWAAKPRLHLGHQERFNRKRLVRSAQNGRHGS